jgi:hypothetical protein
VVEVNRVELFQIAEKNGIRENAQRALVLTRQELIDYFNSEKGQQELSHYRIYVEFNDDFPLAVQKVERVVDLLMMEVEAYARDIEKDGREG